MQIKSCELKRYAESALKEGKTLGLCHGCFDIIHHGHIAHFKIAKDQCDILFVSVTADNFVNKGPGRPYNCLTNRLKVIDAIKYIDYSFESNHSDGIWSINQVQPQLFFKGSDYIDNNNFNKNFNREKEHAESLGIKTIFTDGETSSSTLIYKKLVACKTSNHHL